MANLQIEKMLYDNGPVAQLDRAPDFESVGRVFESRRGHQLKLKVRSNADFLI